MKKLEIVKKAMDLLKLTPQQVVQNFVEKKEIDTDFLQKEAESARYFEAVTLIPSKKIITPKDIQPGMYEYASGLISPLFLKEEQMRGVVGYVNEREILVWCLRCKELCWSEEFWEAGTSEKKLRGWQATEIILDKAKKLRKSAPAAEYCHNYTDDWIPRGEAFLPSLYDHRLLQKNQKFVDDAFNRVGIHFGGNLWSSTEDITEPKACAIYVNGGEGGKHCNKGQKDFIVRPVYRIKR